MGQRTKIDWADATWNPVTGCRHGCPYCYARKIAERFVQEYPFGFEPTFHTDRLEVPTRWKKPKNIFVCSMADLFGEWVPDEWIEQVFEACKSAPQHRYLFLTKNPSRYMELSQKDVLPKGGGFWYGTSTPKTNIGRWWSDEHHTFVSVEPVLEPFVYKNRQNDGWRHRPEWIIVGAETGNRKGRVVPKKDWIDGVVSVGKEYNIPVFMKESLRGMMGDDFVQEFPW